MVDNPKALPNTPAKPTLEETMKQSVTHLVPERQVSS